MLSCLFALCYIMFCMHIMLCRSSYYNLVNNQRQMANLKSIHLLVFFLLLTICHGKMTFIANTVPLPTLTQLKCLKTSGYLEEVFITTLYNSVNHTWAPVTSPSDCENAGTVPHLILGLSFIKWQNTTPELQAYYFAKQFASTHLKMIWLAPVNSNLYRNNITCQVFQNFARELQKQTNLKVGIESNSKTWTQTFGSINACPELASMFPLFVFTYDKPIAFGGWTRWDFSYLQTNSNLCGINQIQIKKS